MFEDDEEGELIFGGPEWYSSHNTFGHDQLYHPLLIAQRC